MYNSQPSRAYPNWIIGLLGASLHRCGSHNAASVNDLTLLFGSQRRLGTAISSGTLDLAQRSGYSDVARHATVHQAFLDVFKGDCRIHCLR